MGSTILMDDARSRLNNLKGRSSQPRLVGINKASSALLALISKIELDLAISKINGTEHETKMSVTRELVKFTNQTEPEILWSKFVRKKDLPVFWRVTKKAIKSVSIHLPNEQNNARLRDPVVRTATLPI
jgi:hypothetical protein